MYFRSIIYWNINIQNILYESDWSRRYELLIENSKFHYYARGLVTTFPMLAILMRTAEEYNTLCLF